MRITVIAGSGIGGTEKAAYLFAAELARRGHEVEAITDSSNHRLVDLAKAGVTLRDISCDSQGFLAYLKGFRPELVHHHTSGYGDHRAIYQAMDAMGSEKPKLIETNVFGRLMDRYEAGHVAMRMFVSMTSGCQAFRRPMWSKQRPDINRHTVLYNPLPPPTPMPLGKDHAFRADIGVLPSDFLLVRVGRPGHKWATWECEAFHQARKIRPNLRLVLMEPTEEIKKAIRKGDYGDGIVVLEATSNQEFIDRLYGASDAMLHASSFGESYGYTLAEGLRRGLPVITRTTPWADNAQVELVRHGESGFVCCSIAGMTGSILELAVKPDLREFMAQNAIRSVESLCDLAHETDLLEEIMDHVVSGQVGPEMSLRFGNWIHYRNLEFARAEWNIQERQARHFPTYLAGRFHNICQQQRAAVGPIYRRLRCAFTKRRASKVKHKTITNHDIQ